jgi:hypothetical protein
LAQFTRPNEDQRREAQGTAYGEDTFIIVDGSEYLGHLLRFSGGGKVLAFDRRQSAAQIIGGVAFRTARNHSVAENLATIAQYTVGGFQGAPLFNPADDLQ